MKLMRQEFMGWVLLEADISSLSIELNLLQATLLLLLPCNSKSLSCYKRKWAHEEPYNLLILSKRQPDGRHGGWYTKSNTPYAMANRFN